MPPTTAWSEGNQGSKIWLLFVNNDVNRDGHIAASPEHDRMGKGNDATIDGLSGPQRRSVLVVRWITHVNLEIVGHDLESGHERLLLDMRLTRNEPRTPVYHVLGVKRLTLFAWPTGCGADHR